MKILVLRFSSIGDIVLTTPVVRCLKAQLTDSEIHFLTRRSYSPLLAHNPNIHKIWYFEKNVSEIIGPLQNENFDFVADLHCNWRSYRLRMALGRPSAGFPKLNLKKWLLVNAHIHLMPNQHVVDRYFKSVERLGVYNDMKGCEIFIPPNKTLDDASLPEIFRKGFIAMVIGAKHFTKQIPESLAIDIIQRLPLPVLLIGGKEDYEKGVKIAREAGNRVYNACGRYSLLRSASALRLSQLVITGDTGMMHMAAALHKKIIVIWGNTVPDFGMGPYLPGYEHLVTHCEVAGLSCRPCSKLGYKQCPKRHFRCMTDQDVTRIAQTAYEWLTLKI